MWVNTDSGYELLEAEGGFDIAGGLVTLDDFEDVTVPQAESVEFLFTVDVADNDAVIGGTFFFTLVNSDIEDDDNNQLCGLSGSPACSGANSTRVVTIEGSGELTVEADNADSETNDEKYILAGKALSSSDFVASFELTAQNEGVEIEDMTLVVSGDTTMFAQAAQEVVIYDEDKSTILFRETVTTVGTVVFNNINLIVEEGSMNIYVKIETDIIGDNENGVETANVHFALVVDNVEGEDSGDESTVTYDGVTQSLFTNTFAIVPVKFSDVEFVTSAAGSNVATSTTDGNDKNIAILKLTADSWDNTDRTDGGDLEVYVNTLNFTTNVATGSVDGYEIRRIGNGSTNYIACTVSGDQVSCPVSSGSVNAREFVSTEVGYFLVRADVTFGASNGSVKLTLDNLNG